MQTVSKQVFYSYGIVAANMKPGTTTISVTPIEDMPLISGEITDNYSTMRVSAPDSSGEVYQSQVGAAPAITASWMPFSDANRVTAPYVRIGDLVAIYRFADRDKYEWTTLKNDMTIRRLEVVTWVFSNLPDGNEEATVDNSYYFHFSTIDKVVRLHTANTDGEVCAIDFQLNGKLGTVSLSTSDTEGNGIYLELDFSEDRFTVTNENGETFELKPNSIVAELNDGSSTTITPGQITHKATTVTLDASTVKTTSNLEVGGNLSMAGGGQMTGAGWSLDSQGNMQLNTVQAQTYVSAPNIP